MRKTKNRNRQSNKVDTTNVKPIKKTKSTKLAQALDVPVSAIKPCFHIDLESNKSAVVEGIEGVLEYSDTIAKIKTKDLIICFKGTDILLKCMTDTATIIEGRIVSIEFLTV